MAYLRGVIQHTIATSTRLKWLNDVPNTLKTTMANADPSLAALRSAVWIRKNVCHKHLNLHQSFVDSARVIPAWSDILRTMIAYLNTSTQKTLTGWHQWEPAVRIIFSAQRLVPLCWSFVSTKIFQKLKQSRKSLLRHLKLTGICTKSTMKSVSILIVRRYETPIQS